MTLSYINICLNPVQSPQEVAVNAVFKRHSVRPEAMSSIDLMEKKHNAGVFTYLSMYYRMSLAQRGLQGM